MWKCALLVAFSWIFVADKTLLVMLLFGGIYFFYFLSFSHRFIRRGVDRVRSGDCCGPVLLGFVFMCLPAFTCLNLAKVRTSRSTDAFQPSDFFSLLFLPSPRATAVKVDAQGAVTQVGQNQVPPADQSTNMYWSPANDGTDFAVYFLLAWGLPRRC